jgi:hypothetical protein
MASLPENEALLPTVEVVDTPRVGERPIGLPIDLVIQSVSRLRVLALLYAFVFFMVAVLPVLVVRQDRARLLGSFVLWGPRVISIAVALFVAALIGRARMPLSAKVNLGLAFEVAASYGFAAAEFFDPSSLAVKGTWTGPPPPGRVGDASAALMPAHREQRIRPFSVRLPRTPALSDRVGRRS